VIALALMLGSLVFLVYILIPPLVTQAPTFIDLLPDRTEIQALIERLRLMIQALPGPTQEAVLRILQTVSVTLREYLDQNLSGFAGAIVVLLIGIFNSIGFILGLLIVPAWLLTVLNDQRRGVRALNRILPAPIEKDFWAVVKIIVRPCAPIVSGRSSCSPWSQVAVYLGCFLE
jgi:predicted PurR-regulated permease PerM